jgi:hypothetical protein
VIAITYVITYGNHAALKARKGYTLNNKVPMTIPRENCTVDVGKAYIDKFGAEGFSIAEQWKLFIEPDCHFVDTVMKQHQGGNVNDDDNSSAATDADADDDEYNDLAHYVGYGGTSDKRPIDEKMVAFLLDAFPPPILCCVQSPWIPTVSFNVYFFQPPPAAEDAITLARLNFSTTACKYGLLTTDGECWDNEGNLLATSSQIARVWG